MRNVRASLTGSAMWHARVFNRTRVCACASQSRQRKTRCKTYERSSVTSVRVSDSQEARELSRAHYTTYRLLSIVSFPVAVKNTYAQCCTEVVT